MAEKELLIQAEVLYDGKTRKLGAQIRVQGDRILDVAAGGPGKAPDMGAIKGFVTPAFIDAHCHIGMERQGEPMAESEVNEKMDPFTPLLNPLDSIYFDDRAFEEAVDFGVLYACVVPGSGNIMGGRAMVIRNFAQNRAQALVKDYGFKLALGFNPRALMDWKGIRPSTRMGAAAMLEAYLSEVLRAEEQAAIRRDKALAALDREAKDQRRPVEKAMAAKLIRREYELALTDAQWAVFRLVQGEKIAKIHVHKADDALYLVDLKKRYNMRISAEHCGEIAQEEIFNTLADHDIPVVYGPLGSFDYKVELKNASYRHVAALLRSRARFGYMTDHPVIPAHHLRDSLKYFLIQGMSETDAVSLITYQNARILGIDQDLGSVEPGKLASLIVWDRDPFHLGAMPLVVVAEGRVIRDNR